MPTGIRPCDFCGELFANRLAKSNHQCAEQFLSNLEIKQDQTKKCSPQTSSATATKSVDIDSTKKKNIRILLNRGRLQLKSIDLRCEKCLGEFSNRSDLEEHKKAHCNDSTTTLFEIETASNSKSAESALDDEARFVDFDNDLGDYFCNDCGLEFDDAGECRQHIIDEHLEPSDYSNRSIGHNLMKALQSGKEAELKSYNNDMQIDDRSDKFACSLCDGNFNDKSELFEHTVNAHNKRVLYECSVCQKMFVQRLALTRHLQGHKAANFNTAIVGRSQSFECRFCSKQFLFESFLRRHEATHTSGCYYNCEICGDHFKTQSSLVLHKAEHTGSQLFTCPKCGKTFPYRSYLERHYKTHAAEPSPCSECDEIFTVPSQLQKHMVFYHGEAETTLSCPQCDRKFMYPSYLERHLAMHIQNREHECPICRRRFLVRGALLSHLQRHLPDSSSRINPYKCRFCLNSYRHESSLERHVQKMHADSTSIGRREEERKRERQRRDLAPEDVGDNRVVNLILD